MSDPTGDRNGKLHREPSSMARITKRMPSNWWTPSNLRSLDLVLLRALIGVGGGISSGTAVGMALWMSANWGYLTLLIIPIVVAVVIACCVAGTALAVGVPRSIWPLLGVITGHVIASLQPTIPNIEPHRWRPSWWHDESYLGMLVGASVGCLIWILIAAVQDRLSENATPDALKQ